MPPTTVNYGVGVRERVVCQHGLEGASVADVARRLEVSEATFRRWRNQCGGLKAVDVKRLKALEAENARLERVVADKELEIDTLRETGRAKW